METKQGIGTNKVLRKLALAGVITALSFATSSVVVLPNMAPFQHFFNVITVVILGPWYAVAIAFLTGGLRMILAGRTILAIVGAIFGAAMGGVLYRMTGKYIAVVIGEIIGTGVVSAIVSVPVMNFLYHAKVPSIYFYIPFFLPAAVVGAVLGYIFLKFMKQTKILDKLQ
ncbi:energy coupling factor transporter S component ThiW [Leuconostoc rapi]|uniref:energy coupling factor transporter S component ThiW n=1 Tax=Leuconostoc rapi TaxID=1406906 RepID=UPI00195B1AED|nr:energy coupling factor transporter S component ThiW [Leuconostoc rapi]MBM7436225.1 energy coupling factor transporter S component ThiW [Leuconostoc rapi]